MDKWSASRHGPFTPREIFPVTDRIEFVEIQRRSGEGKRKILPCRETKHSLPACIPSHTDCAVPNLSVIRKYHYRNMLCKNKSTAELCTQCTLNCLVRRKESWIKYIGLEWFIPLQLINVKFTCNYSLLADICWNWWETKTTYWMKIAGIKSSYPMLDQKP